MKTPEETQLSALLDELTPAPPRRLTVQDIASRLERDVARPKPARRPWRTRWLPAVGAIGLVLALVVALIVTQGGGDRRPRPVDSLPHRTIPAPPSVAVGPWHATLRDHLRLLPGSLLAGDGALFGLVDEGGGRADLVRIDPASGSVLARAAVAGSPLAPVLVRGSIWVTGASVEHGAVSVAWFDPTSLSRRGAVTVPFSGSSSAGAEFAAGGGRVYLGFGNSVAVLDPADGRVQKRIPVDGEVRALAVTPDGSRLYVDSVRADVGELRVVNAATGSTLTAIPNVVVSNGDSGLLATAGGLWLSMAGGHSQTLSFVPASAASAGRLDHQVVVGYGGGGEYTTLTIAQGVAWIGGPYAIACADPDTGKVRAQASLPSDARGPRELSGLTYVGGAAYAIYRPGDLTGGLVRLTPPGDCLRG